MTEGKGRIKKKECEWMIYFLHILSLLTGYRKKSPVCQILRVISFKVLKLQSNQIKKVFKTTSLSIPHYECEKKRGNSGHCFLIGEEKKWKRPSQLCLQKVKRDSAAPQGVLRCYNEECHKRKKKIVSCKYSHGLKKIAMPSHSTACYGGFFHFNLSAI